VGVLIGGAMQLIINIPFLIKNNFLFRFSGNLFHPAVRGLVILVAPQLFGLAVYNFNILVNTQYASFMPDGTITYLYFSERLIEFPLGVIAVSIATVMLPKLSAEAASKNFDVFRKDYLFSLQMMLYILIPSLMGLIALRVPLCTVLFQRGEFSDTAVLNTAQAVLGYAIGLWAIGGLRITVPAFYALKDTKTPVKIAFIAFIVNIIFGYVLGIYFSMHQLGLAIASSISSILNFILLFYILNSRTKQLFSRQFILFVTRITIIALLMGISTWFLSGYINWSDNESFTNFIALSGIILTSFVIYFGLTKFIKIKEADYLLSILRRKDINT